MTGGLGAEHEDVFEISAKHQTQAHSRQVGLIWAQSTSGVIGRDNTIPWRLPEDLRHFKDLTMGNTVVMGRLTWDSLPEKVRPLPGRNNVVLSRHADFKADGAAVVATLDEALIGGQTWVIGGAQIYALALPMATRCEITEVDIDLPPAAGDALAPDLDSSWGITAGDWLTSSSGLRYRYLSCQRA